jgi:hypothetical protein
LRWVGNAGMAAQQHSARKAVRRAWTKTRKRRGGKGSSTRGPRS